MKTKIFKDTHDLFCWLFNNSKMASDLRVSDRRYSREIDNQLDNICKKLKQGKTVIRHNFIIKVEEYL